MYFSTCDINNDTYKKKKIKRQHILGCMDSKG